MARQQTALTSSGAVYNQKNKTAILVGEEARVFPKRKEVVGTSTGMQDCGILFSHATVLQCCMSIIIIIIIIIITNIYGAPHLQGKALYRKQKNKHY